MTRLALVTGANRGIGHEVCRQLAQRRLRVVLTARHAKDAEAAAAELTAAGLDVVPAALDVSDPDSVARCARDVTARLGGVDVLVNNAAILIAENDALVSTPLDAFRRTFETNVWGALAVC
jgi:NAD(P)-dependent dehydrogenase (short-subunit alcohol dehydrogenase family)